MGLEAEGQVGPTLLLERAPTCPLQVTAARPLPDEYTRVLTPRGAQSWRSVGSLGALGLGHPAASGSQVLSHVGGCTRTGIWSRGID